MNLKSKLTELDYYQWWDNCWAVDKVWVEYGMLFYADKLDKHDEYLSVDGNDLSFLEAIKQLKELVEKK